MSNKSIDNAETFSEAKLLVANARNLAYNSGFLRTRSRESRSVVPGETGDFKVLDVENAILAGDNVSADNADGRRFAAYSAWEMWASSGSSSSMVGKAVAIGVNGSTEDPPKVCLRIFLALSWGGSSSWRTAEDDAIFGGQGLRCNFSVQTPMQFPLEAAPYAALYILLHVVADKSMVHAMPVNWERRIRRLSHAAQTDLASKQSLHFSRFSIC